MRRQLRQGVLQIKCCALIPNLQLDRIGKPNDLNCDRRRRGQKLVGMASSVRKGFCKGKLTLKPHFLRNRSIVKLVKPEKDDRQFVEVGCRLKLSRLQRFQQRQSLLRLHNVSTHYRRLNFSLNPEFLP